MKQGLTLLLIILIGVMIMAHGTPDWGQSKVTTVFSQVDDLAELAARLKSPVTFDRRGNVIWLDDFSEGSLAFLHGEYGTGAEVALTSSYPNRAPFCVKLTGGSDAGANAALTRYICPQTLGKLGLEASVAFFSDFNYFRLEIEQYDGSQLHRARIQASDVDDKIYYLASDSSLKELADLPDVVMSYGTYHTLKLVADFSTGYYTRFLFNQNSYDLSDHAIQITDSVTTPHTLIRLSLYSRSGQNDYCHVDDVILTQNEP